MLSGKWGCKMSVTLKQKELAELVGLTDRHIRRIDQTLDPDEKLLVKAEDGGFDATVFVQRYVAMKVKEVTDGMENLDAVKARHEIVKTEKTQLEVARMRGNCWTTGTCGKHGAISSML